MTESNYPGLISLIQDYDIEGLVIALDNGGDVNEIYAKKAAATPLHCACIMDSVDAVNILLDRGANMLIANQYGRLAICYAYDNNNFEIVRAMLERGFPVNTKISQWSTPLTEACSKRDVQMVRLLMDMKADVNMSGSDCPGGLKLTPLMDVCDGREGAEMSGESVLDIVKLLIEHGADPGIKSKYGKVAFNYACENRLVEVAKYFLGFHERWCEIKTDGYQLIKYCSHDDCYEIVKILLEYGVDPNSKSEDNDMTPLIDACNGALKNIVWLLLGYGANPCPRGYTFVMSDKWMMIGYVLQDHTEWNNQSALLCISQDTVNEGSDFHYLGVCLYDIMDLMFPEKPDA